MKKTYPRDSILYASEEEKRDVKRYAKRCGVCVSSLGRLLLLQAAREGWSVGVLRYPRPASPTTEDKV